MTPSSGITDAPAIVIDPERYTRIAKLGLTAGSHASPDDAICLMEAAAYLAREQHSDQPICVSEVLGEIGRGLNDTLPHADRQRLIPLIPELLGTRPPGVTNYCSETSAQRPGVREYLAAERARLFVGADWVLRSWAPTWLQLLDETAGFADELRAMDPITADAHASDANIILARAFGIASYHYGPNRLCEVPVMLRGNVLEAVRSSGANSFWHAAAGSNRSHPACEAISTASEAASKAALGAMGNWVRRASTRTRSNELAERLAPIVTQLRSEALETYAAMIKTR